MSTSGGWRHESEDSEGVNRRAVISETTGYFTVACVLRATTMCLIEVGKNGGVDVGLFPKLNQ